MPRPLAVIAVIVLVAGGTVRAAGDAEPAPSIRFDATTHDFGSIRSDAKQTFSWAYHNDGTAPLEIRGTNPSCGCTASVADPKTVPPGGSGALAIVYDPAGQSGSVRKTITVITNDPARPHTILTIRASVIATDAETPPSGHPRFTGQSLLMGSCAGCHAAPASGKSGAALWNAVCAMCHGTTGQGALAPSVREKDYLASRSDQALAQAIAYGTANPKMPGFSDLMGGPLDGAQIASLVKLLRQWGPAPAHAPAPTPPPGR